MSLFGALGTAVSGLAGQAAAFSDISDNMSNSQTTGFKRVDTTFTDYLTDSTALQNESGSVAARPLYENNVQGSITQNDNALAFAVSGSGFFSVSRATQSVNGITSFSPQTFYTRAGDFQLNKDGYMVNSQGDYLNGWQVNSKGIPQRNAVAPIQVTQTIDSPVPTTTMTLSANLPSYDDPNKVPNSVSSSVNVYDAEGGVHALQLGFVPVSGTAGQWTLTVTDDKNKDPVTGIGNVIGTATVTFAANGTLEEVNQADGNGIDNKTNGTAASVQLVAPDYAIIPAPNDTSANAASQKITLNLGIIGQAGGLTQYAGSTDYTLRGISQDGVPPGAFSQLTNTSAGDIVANFDNGQSRVVARVPVITFPNPDALQRQDGSAFSGTTSSGDPLAHDAGTSGAGHLVTSATEASNVDISAEMTKLIIAQQAYSANAKLITTADDMLSQTINMKR